jgi:hypothetical protein
MYEDSNCDETCADTCAFWEIIDLNWSDREQVALFKIGEWYA